MDYLIHLGILICIYIILAQSFNLSFGVGRLFNLAHISVYAIGAYTTALLATEAGTGFLACIFTSMLLAGLFALLIGGIALKLTQDYFAIGTLAFSSVVTALLVNWKSLTRGVLGIPGIPHPVLNGFEFAENRDFLKLMIVLVIISQSILWVLFRGSYSRSLRAQAESEHAALSLGRNTRRVRTWSFFIASCFAGMAGAMYAYYMSYIDPSSFSLAEMIFVLTIVVVGKPGSFWGVIFSSTFLVLLPESLRFVELSPSILGPMRQMLYALILFSVVYWNRARLFPLERTI